MPAYIEDVLTELEKHHRDQSSALITLSDLAVRGGDYKVAAKTARVNNVNAALNALECAVCKQLALDFAGEPRP